MTIKRIVSCMLVFALCIGIFSLPAHATVRRINPFVFDTKEFAQEDGCCILGIQQYLYNCITSINEDTVKAYIICNDPTISVKCQIKVVWDHNGDVYESKGDSSAHGTAEASAMAWDMVDGAEVYGSICYTVVEYYVERCLVATTVVDATDGIVQGGPRPGNGL